MADSLSIPIVLRVRTPPEILDRWFSSGRSGGLTVDGDLPGNLGQSCQLRIQVQEPRRSFHLEGRLAWARHKGSRGLKASYGVELVGRPETVQRLLALAKEQFPPDRSRTEDRTSLGLKVTLSYEGHKQRVKLSDLSPSGAFVRTSEPLPRGSSLQLSVRPPRSLRGLKIHGKVAWVRVTGPTPGMGIRFSGVEPSEGARLKRLIARFAPPDASR